jgi:hypothetical protein
MIKHIFLAGISVLLYGAVCSQHANAYSVKKTGQTVSTAAAIGFISLKGAKYHLPKKAPVTGLYKENTIYQGNTKGHQLTDRWQSWYPTGQLLDSGTLIKGVPHGIWKTWDVNGNLLSMRTYDADKFRRIKNEMLRYNPRMATYPLLRIYQRDRHRALYYLQAGYSYSFTGHRGYELSLQHAVEENIRPGNIYHPVFDDCLHHGLYINYFPAGIAKDSGYYRNGLKEGLWVHRNADRSLSTGAYKNGNRIGDWKVYSPEGRIRRIILYNKNGEEEWSRELGMN